MKKLNLGCGYDVRKGYINIDNIKNKGVDMVFNLNKYPYPFKNNSIDEIYCCHILEHLNDFDKTIKEFHRILKKDGMIIIIVPDFSSCNAYVPVHKTFFNLNSFNLYCSNIHDRSIKQPLFKMIEKKLLFPFEHMKGWKKFIVMLYYLMPLMVYDANKNIYMIFLSRIFPASETYFKLKAVK